MLNSLKKKMPQQEDIFNESELHSYYSDKLKVNYQDYIEKEYD